MRVVGHGSRGPRGRQRARGVEVPVAGLGRAAGRDVGRDGLQRAEVGRQQDSPRGEASDLGEPSVVEAVGGRAEHERRVVAVPDGGPGLGERRGERDLNALALERAGERLRPAGRRVVGRERVALTRSAGDRERGQRDDEGEGGQRDPRPAPAERLAGRPGLGRRDGGGGRRGRGRAHRGPAPTGSCSTGTAVRRSRSSAESRSSISSVPGRPRYRTASKSSAATTRRAA